MDIKINEPPPAPPITFTLTLTQGELLTLRYFATRVDYDNIETATRFLAKTREAASKCVEAVFEECFK